MAPITFRKSSKSIVCNQVIKMANYMTLSSASGHKELLSLLVLTAAGLCKWHALPLEESLSLDSAYETLMGISRSHYPFHHEIVSSTTFRLKFFIL